MNELTREEVIKYFTDALSLLVSWERDGDAFLVNESGQIGLWNQYFDKTYSATEDFTPFRVQYLAALIRSLPEPNAATVAIEGVEYVRRDVVEAAMAYSDDLGMSRAALNDRRDPDQIIAEARSAMSVHRLGIREAWAGQNGEDFQAALDAAIKEAEA